MNRRSFFSTLAKVGAGLLVAPSLYLPKSEGFRWKRTQWVENPLWTDCEWEIRFIDMAPMFDSAIIEDTRPVPNQFGPLALASTPPCHAQASTAVRGIRSPGGRVVVVRSHTPSDASCRTYQLLSDSESGQSHGSVYKRVQSWTHE